MNPLKIEVQHSADTVLALTRAQYAVSHRTARLIQVITAIVSLLIGIHFIGNVKEPFSYLFIIYGCFSIVFLNVPSNSMANKVIQRIQSAGQPYPCSVFTFYEKDFSVKAKGPSGKIEHYNYQNCYRLLAYRHATFYFLNKQAAFIFPDDCLREISVSHFHEYLAQKTGKPCQILYPWLLASLHFTGGKKKHQ